MNDSYISGGRRRKREGRESAREREKRVESSSFKRNSPTTASNSLINLGSSTPPMPHSIPMHLLLDLSQRGAVGIPPPLRRPEGRILGGSRLKELDRLVTTTSWTRIGSSGVGRAREGDGGRWEDDERAVRR